MKIITVNGLYDESGASQTHIEPLVYGALEKVELIIKAGEDSFDTFGFKGYIDYCDSSPTELITTRKVHSFSYPSEYTPEKVSKTDPETNITTDYDKHKIILYFSREMDYGIINGRLLSQADSVTPFPEFVFFEADENGKEELLILNEDFKSSGGLTKNLYSRPYFYKRLSPTEALELDIPPGLTVSTFKVFPKIYSDLKDASVFPAAHNPNVDSVYSPLGGDGMNLEWANLESVEQQGQFSEKIETLLGFNFDSLTPNVTARMKLEAYPKGGSPKTIINFYNVKADIDSSNHSINNSIRVNKLPETKDYYSTKNLETLINSWSIPLEFNYDDTDELIDERLPLGPDYSNSTKLKVIKFPTLTISSPRASGIAIGPKLIYPELPNSLKLADGTHTVFKVIENSSSSSLFTKTLTVGVYSKIKEITKTKGSRFNDDEQIINDELPHSVEIAFNYYNSDFGQVMNSRYTEDNSNFIYPPLHEGIIATSNYFSLKLDELNTNLLTIPGLPSTLKYISGYCANLTDGLIINPSASGIFLQDVDNLTLEPNACSNLESIDNWMMSSYRGSNINLGYRTNSLIQPLPSLSPSGIAKNSFNGGFALKTNWGTQLNYTGTRSIPLTVIEPFIPDIANSSQHLTSLIGVLSGEFNGAIDNIALKAGFNSYHYSPLNSPEDNELFLFWSGDAEANSEEFREGELTFDGAVYGP